MNYPIGNTLSSRLYFVRPEDSMIDRNRLFRLILLFMLLALVSVAAWSDTMNGVTSPAGLSANDSVKWSQLGANGTVLGATINATSDKGLAVNGTLNGANSITAKVCAASPCSWRGAGFTAGDTLIWTSDAANAGNGPLTLNFAKKIAGAGAFIQADGPGSFTVQIQAFNGSTSLGTFQVNSNGNAVFIGILDQTAANISSVVFSLTGCAGSCSDFAIDTLSLNTGSGSSYSLTVSLAGTGTGSVTSSPAGINCPGTCTAQFTAGTSVTLTETPGAGSSFAGWSGACTGTGSCTVVMNSAQSVTATFSSSTQYALSVSLSGTGSGSVTSSPTGINCPGTCSANYAGGTVVTLTAAAKSGSIFTGWGGACTGKGTCTVTITQSTSVKAKFALTYPLTVNRVGSGKVKSTPTGIACGLTCSHDFKAGTVVTLTETPALGHTFTGWSGACSGTGSCTVTMSAAKTVGATFN